MCSSNDLSKARKTMTAVPAGSASRKLQAMLDASVSEEDGGAPGADDGVEAAAES